MNEPATNPNRSKFIFAGVIVLLLILAGVFTVYRQRDETPQGSVEQSESERNDTPTTGKEKPLKNEVRVYFIDLENKRAVMETIGCGDSVIAISRATPTEGKSTEELISAALGFLLEEPDQFVGKSGYYNSLYQSDLELDRVSVENSIAKVYLKGKMLLGGTCDSPRFEAQLTSTVIQFNGITEVELFLDDKPLDLSQRG
ncbi:hypothetical protein A2976_01620 [candidate division WWE3 bacterium RIFCSPLOWO2_01_FULL_41_9]|uniref:GerMN domain-containing protein n=1 Tax=candidate division WWE3 bacterium RIFCSPLOWO2_01_FULL_41_9 TaxID=1802626 RepID=A0A1F4VLL3_UNCKA|nr:MAG: hypothetical protein A2976_01620 [candidate division WWE3 bacterium RIFCSPLOWO2_01_FULL_41_9]